MKQPKTSCKRVGPTRTIVSMNTSYAQKSKRNSYRRNNHSKGSVGENKTSDTSEVIAELRIQNHQIGLCTYSNANEIRNSLRQDQFSSRVKIN